VAAISPPHTTASTLLPRAAFFALQGRWSLERTLNSSFPDYPSGTFRGVATFYPRYPTSAAYYAEYLYIEQGTLTLASSGQKIEGSRRYVYRYHELRDELSVWFVKPEDGTSVDYLFHQVAFLPHQDGIGGAKWEGRGFHLCEKDEYEAGYELTFRGVAIESFMINYDVKGPKKQYTAAARYHR
jgi:hypothetical protein